MSDAAIPPEQQAESLIEALLHAVPAALVVVDEDLRVRRANEAFCSAFASTRARMPGQPLADVLGDLWGKPELQHLLAHAFGPRPDSGKAEIECALTGAEVRTICLHAHPLAGPESSRPRLVLLRLEDVTERRQSERRLAEYQRRLQRLVAMLMTVEDRERRRIADDLHDRIGQSLAVIQMRIGMLRSSSGASDQVDMLDRLYKMIDQTVRDTRSLTFEISPPVLYSLGLGAALEWLAEVFQKMHGLRVAVREDRRPKPLGDDLAALLFRATRELLFNVLKHASQARASVSLRRQGGCVHIEVADDGPGFDPRAVLDGEFPADSFGIFSIRERLAAFGGRLELDSAPGQGTRCVLVAPLDLARRKRKAGARPPRSSGAAEPAGPRKDRE